jgi:CheY-like chemotaxis protein
VVTQVPREIRETILVVEDDSAILNMVKLILEADGAMLVLNHGWHFIAKPFLASALLARANDVLCSAVREQGTDHFDTRHSADHEALWHRGVLFAESVFRKRG